MGRHYHSFVRDFFKKLNYPNCFEQLIAESNISLLHAHFGMTGARALRLKRQVRLPLITSFYGVDASRQLKNPQNRRHLSRLFDQGDLHLVLGPNMAQRLTDFGCKPEKVRVQRLAVDLSAIPFRRRTWPEDDRVVLLYCGRVVEKKGIEYALRAFGRLAEVWPQLEFRVIGGGRREHRMVSLVKELELQNRVRLVGPLPNNVVLQEMEKAHLFIFPSVTATDGDMEGTPTAILEAQASGMPVVSTLHADIPQILPEENRKLLTREKDIDGLEDILDTLLRNPDMWPKIGVAGRRHVEQWHNIDREVERIEDLYRELV